jgi:hypothetical protein
MIMTTVTPPSPRERLEDWSAKAWTAGYDFVTGPRQQVSEYERCAMLDGATPSTDKYDYFEEVGYGY